jgi:cytochrome d ubiquinol oxidase subunit I
MMMFAVFYVVLLSSFFYFARRWLKNGPDVTLMPPAEPLPSRQPVAQATVEH